MNDKRIILKKFFTEIQSEKLINGTVLIAKDGEILYKGAFGEAELDSKRKLKINSIFNLASVSKPITALGIMLLVQDNKLSLDDPIEKWLPNIPYKGVTVRQLLNHTSGLPDYLELFEHHWDKSKIAVNQDLLELLIKHKPEQLFKPNERMEYSNTGYVMLALIIEKVSGLSFAEYMKINIFSPVGMQNTEVFCKRLTEQAVDNYAYGYIFDVYKGKHVLPDEFPETDFVVYLDGIVGDGAIHSTVEDLYLLDRVLRNGTLIDETLLKEAYSPSFPRLESPFKYGFGWILENEKRKGRAVWHSGGWPGYATHFKRYIDNDLVIIFLRNKEQDFDFEQSILQSIENILFNEPYEIPKLPDFQKAKILHTEILNRYVGEYRLEEHTELIAKVTMKDQRLFLELPRSMKLEMYATSDNEFFLRSLSVTINFANDGINHYLTINDGSISQTAKLI
ncbi:serine hydrolase [Desnuesiella massiliensis]|uniref:serine hydrolase n=1 Tax=Desnuesiella massiliensis TaxID=1650662 RepID=UPI0006E29F5B|nr:serine hydrolase [Desnuesiella massiliensis]